MSMLLNILVLFCLTLTASGVIVEDEELPDLEWPETYSFEAHKLRLNAGWSETYKVWRTDKKSRVDYNNGAVKEFVTTSAKGSRSRYGVKYEIHPETTEEELNKIVCNKIRGTRFHRIEPEDALPSLLDDFEPVGSDIVRDIETVKFVYKEVDETADNRKTLWAAYNNVTEAWIPVRYEDSSYNTWLGYQEKHEFWDIFNFETEVDEDVFNTDTYDCEESSIEHKMDDESVTQHLMFINPNKKEHVDHIFDAFKQKFNRNYAHEEEHAMRRDIFQRKMRLIVSKNRQNLGYKLAINQFADRTPEEMNKHRGLLRRKEGETGNVPFPYSKTRISQIADTLPKEYDLRMLGVITPVQNQGECGSCWTFGTTAAVEGALARVNGGRLLRLSNQALIDCAWGYGAAGCDGGSDTAAYKWMMKHGLPTEEEYGTYANRDGYCLIENMTEIYPIRGFTDVTPFSVEALKVAVINHGPLSVSIDASSESLGLYSGGIFYDPECNPRNLNHEVTLVGYGERDGETYWIVKNSWGTTWGIDGYIHISVRDNNCGIATEPTYVVF